jgi:hypothetical protein
MRDASPTQRAHADLPDVHRVAGLTKRWLSSTHQGAVGDSHLQAYLDVLLPVQPSEPASVRDLFYRLLEQSVASPQRTQTQLLRHRATRQAGRAAVERQESTRGHARPPRACEALAPVARPAAVAHRDERPVIGWLQVGFTALRRILLFNIASDNVKTMATTLTFGSIHLRGPQLRRICALRR